MSLRRGLSPNQRRARRRKLPRRRQEDLLVGNHELRLLKHIADRSPFLKVLLDEVMGMTMEDVFGVNKHKINLICKLDLRAYKAMEVRDQIRQNYEVYYGCYACTHEPDPGLGMSGTNGHYHKAILNTFTNLQMGNCSWIQTPAMHRMDAVYIKGRNKADLGFLIAHVNAFEQTVSQYPVIFQENWVCINGIYYKRSDYVYD